MVDSRGCGVILLMPTTLLGEGVNGTNSKGPLMFSILILENLERNLNAAVLEPFPVILEDSWQMQEHF